jgi:hypothetical protein
MQTNKKQDMEIHLKDMPGFIGEVADKNYIRGRAAKGWTIRQAKTATSKSWHLVTSTPTIYVERVLISCPPFKV